jgi:hypothetical protein
LMHPFPSAPSLGQEAKMEDRTTKDVHAEVRGHYGKVARGES